jgi:hypothetical protein
MKYNLNSSQSDRINFDEMVERLAEAALNTIANEIDNIDINEYLNDTWEIESEFMDVDDLEEAKARFFSVFRHRLSYFSSN